MKKGLEQRVIRYFNLAHDDERGISLIETLIALAIMGVVAVVFLTGMTTSSKAVMVSQNRVTAESLAKSQMEDTKAQLYIDGAISYPKITIPQDLVDQGYVLTVVAEPLHASEDGIQKITVTISRNGNGILTLKDYKVNR